MHTTGKPQNPLFFLPEHNWKYSDCREGQTFWQSNARSLGLIFNPALQDKLIWLMLSFEKEKSR